VIEPPERISDDRRRVTAITYGQLGAATELLAESGLSASQVASLRAHPYARPTDLAFLFVPGIGGPSARLALLPGHMAIGASLEPISWASGWHADSGTAAGSLLLLHALRSAPSFGGCLLSESALRVYRAARIDLGRMPRFVLLRRSRRYWEPLVPRALAAVLGVPTDAALRSFARARRRGVVRGFVLDEVKRFDERSDRIDASRAERLYFRRDHREINWAMTHPWDSSAGLRYRCFYVRRTGSSEALGYALVRLRSYGGSRAASVFRTAVRAGEGAALRAMFHAVIDEVERDDPDLIDVAGNDDVVLEAASSRGLFRHGHIDIGCSFGAAARAKLPAGASLSSFRLDMAEGDVLFL
jgi:hypothetical protein